MRLRVPIVILALLCLTVGAQAAQYVFTPADSDLGDLDHGNVYKWGIQWTIPANEVITKATLTYYDIYDWTVENNILYTHVLDTVADTNGGSSPNYANATTTGTASSYKRITFVNADNWTSSDNFNGQGLLLGAWSDTNGPATKNTISYDVPTDKLSWLSDGNFGFGIDPDCHFYNSKVALTVTTGQSPQTPQVPEPVSMVLGSLGLGLVSLLRRRRVI